MLVCLKRLSRFSRARLLATPWTVARQVPLFTGFSRQEYWSELPYSPPDLSEPGIEPGPLRLPSLAGGLFTTSATEDEGLQVHCKLELIL